jgi:hypothetical protein
MKIRDNDFRLRANRFERHESTELPNGKKLYRITRETREWVWLRWVGYSIQMRGLSLRVDRQTFRSNWLGLPRKDGLDEQLFFRREISSPNTEGLASTAGSEPSKL